MHQSPAGLATFLLALDFHLDKTKEIAIIGSEAQKLAQYFNDQFFPNKVLAVGVAPSKNPPLLQDKPAMNGKTTIYICENKVCREPVHDLEKAQKIIQKSLYPY